MRMKGLVIMVMALSALASCGGRRVASDRDCAASPTESYASISGGPGIVSDQDRQFICEAAFGILAGVTFGKMAEQRAENQATRDYARGVIENQGRAGRTLFQLAGQQAGITLPTRLDPAHLAVRDRLAPLSGAAFEQAYLQYEIRAAETSIEAFRQEISQGSEPSVQRFAANNLPLLQQNLATAQGMAGVPAGTLLLAPDGAARTR